MTNRTKIIEGLEMSYKYSNVDENNTLVPQRLILDAITMLKAQETANLYKCPNCGTWVSSENVVRCKDCRHWVAESALFGKCNQWHLVGTYGDDWFCADGERRTEDA